MAKRVKVLAILCSLIFTVITGHSKKSQDAKPSTTIPITTTKTTTAAAVKELLQKSIIAPSWHFQGIGHKWNWKPKFKSDELQGLSLFVRQFKISHKYAKNELIRMFGAESLVESRLKSVKSMAKELDKDDNKTVNDIYDVVTWRVTFPTVKQVS